MPTTYSEWTYLLDKFADGDDTALVDLSEASFAVDAGTATRFYMSVNAVYKKRKQTWLEKFQRSFELQNFKSMEDFEMILRNGKQNLTPLTKFVDLKGLPVDLRKTLKEDLESFVNDIKKTLKDNVTKTSNGNDKMILMLNTFGLMDSPKEVEYKLEQQNNNEIPSTGRKIIF